VLENHLPSSVLWALIIGGLCVALVTVSFVFRIPAANVSMEITAETIEMTLKSAYTIENNLVVKDLGISNVMSFDMISANLPQWNKPAFLKIEGNELIINKLAFSDSATVTLSQTQNRVSISVKNDTLQTEITCAKANYEIDTLKRSINIADGTEQITTLSAPSGVVQFADTSSWTWNNLNISSLRFYRETQLNSGNFESSIVSGKITVLETGQEFVLQQGDWLKMSDLTNRRIQITKTKNNFRINMEGEVKGIVAGPQLFEKNLKPTIAQYFYYAKAVAFFWSIIVFLWGFLWSVKNTAFKKG